MESDRSPFGITEGVGQADTSKKDDANMTATERIIELLYRNLQEVFGEGDAARRRTAIEEFYTDDCVLYVPDGVLVGHAALDKFAGELRATHPHFVYTPHGQAQALHNGGILAWGSGPKGEPPEYTGLDVVIVRESKIAELYVFLNPKLSAA
jgi:SnoaL-like domain